MATESLPTTRRIITGHNADGQAIFDSDTALSPVNPFTEDGSPPEGTIPGFTLIHRTENYPVKVQGPVQELHGKKIALSDSSGTVCRIVDFPPIGEDGDAYMHRTQSLDFAVILKGTIKLILDDGAEKTMNEGDVAVQRGTIHAWKNVSQENCRILFVLIPAEQVKNEKTGEVLEATPTPGLVD